MICGDDDEFITSTPGDDYWWDDDVYVAQSLSIEGTTRVAIDAKNEVTIEVHHVDDNATLPTL